MHPGSIEDEVCGIFIACLRVRVGSLSRDFYDTWTDRDSSQSAHPACTLQYTFQASSAGRYPARPPKRTHAPLGQRIAFPARRPDDTTYLTQVRDARQVRGTVQRRRGWWQGLDSEGRWENCAARLEPGYRGSRTSTLVCPKPRRCANGADHVAYVCEPHLPSLRRQDLPRPLPLTERVKNSFAPSLIPHLTWLGAAWCAFRGCPGVDQG